MFKTISAALLAVSVLAAPAFAATTKADQAPVTKASPVKTDALNANAKMSKHHTRHVRHTRHHTKMSTAKMSTVKSHAKVSFKHGSHTATKRG